MKTDNGREQTKQPRHYTDDDLFGLLVQKGGGLSVEQYLKLPVDTKKKVHRIFRAIKMIPDRFLTSEVQDMIVKDLGVSDYQRVLMMLNQGGYLTREKDFGHRIVHTKTELAKTLTDKRLAADIMSKNDAMVGFPVKRKPRKKAQQETSKGPKPQLRIVDANFKEPKDIEAAPVVDENPVALLAQGGNDPPSMTADVPTGHQELFELLGQLDEGDRLMVTDLVVSLKVTREFFPRLSRRQFLRAFIKGSRYVED